MTTGSDGPPTPGEPVQPPLGQPAPPRDDWGFGGPAPQGAGAPSAAPWAGQPAPDYLGPVAPARRSKRRLVLVSLGAAVVVLVGGGAFAAYTALDGGGPQPEDALPGNVVGYAEIDLDPAAGQKLNAYRLARKFPDAKVTGEDSIKDDLLRQLFEDDESVDYDEDIKPWVGDRAGIAFLDELDEDDEPVVVAALQYTDRDRAEASLRKVQEEDQESGFAFGADGYVILADSTEVAERVVADARKSSLSDNQRYRKALDELGGDRVAVAWADLEGIFDLIPEEYLEDAPAQFRDLDPKGSYILGAKVLPDAVEVNGRGVGIDLGELSKGDVAAGGKGSLVGTLPSNSLVAASVTGLGDALVSSYDQLVDAAKDDEDLSGFLDVGDEIGLSLPQDIKALLGDETALVVVPGKGDQPDVGVRTRGGDPDRGLEVVQSVVAYFSDADPEDVPLDSFLDTTEDGLLFGSAPSALDELGKDGDLGSTESFRRAVPQADAPVVVYVNLNRLLTSYRDELDLSDAEAENAEPLDAFGLTADGDAFTMRLTFR